MMVKPILSLVVLLFMLTGNIYAQTSTNSTNEQWQQGSQSTASGTGNQGSAHHWKPPELAIDACSGKTEGIACEMTTPHGTRNGMCAYTPDKQYLFCRRNHRGGHWHGQQGQGSSGSGTQQ